MFSRIDQRHGGGHARTAVVQYLTTDVSRYLGGRFLDDQVRRGMYSAASELAYLSGWMACDNGEHPITQRYFTIAVSLAAEADDAPMAGHVLRAMAHQAVELGHPTEALNLAAASPGDVEPGRVFFFSEASLAHETACVLRDSGDLEGARREFRRSVRTRKASSFTRTHAVTLGYLGSVQARQGAIEEACGTWSRALDIMDGVHSARARRTAADMRRALSPVRVRGIPAVMDLDRRAAAFLAQTA
ncbi:hypothetical protein ACTWP5_25785 [Streptomyces sp. 4N509B]|uniref:hypothetical protein n=1 Tax=Streptomyces sp. 4N509B TaxID=3457413 RepID=UPI003FCFC57B